MKTENKKIAKILGFKEHRDGQWTYPDDWDKEQRICPVYDIPDFLEMLQIVRDLHDKLDYGIPIDRT